jgi:cell division protease FtsH
MGGRAAEEVVFSQFSTGASDDLSKATNIAREMVCSYGMSEKLGPISVTEADHPIFLGRELSQGPKHSQQTATAIDEEIQAILTMQYERAKSRLVERRDVLDRFAENLLERETLDDRELKILLEGGELPAPEPAVVDAAQSSPETSEEKTADAPDPRFGDKTIPEPEPAPG